MVVLGRPLCLNKSFAKHLGQVDPPGRHNVKCRRRTAHALSAESKALCHEVCCLITFHSCLVLGTLTGMLLQRHSATISKQTGRPGKDNLWLLCGSMYGLGATVPNLILSNLAHQVFTLCWCMCTESTRPRLSGKSLTRVRCSCRSCTWPPGRAVRSPWV